MSSAAAVTYVYNENVNLPIWIDYYGRLFGMQNLYVVDRMSDDGSTSNLGQVNILKIPRREHDEYEKANFMSSLQNALTNCFDIIVMGDCDELLVPDPVKYKNLNEYILRLDKDYVNAVGVDIVHNLRDEAPLDLNRPILSQRRLGRFHSPECKQMLSRKPIRWLPGLHASNMAVDFDPDLILFHTKFMDYGFSVARQQINQSTSWSGESLKQNLGAHHRYDLSKFVAQGFFVPLDLQSRGEVGEFNFTAEIDVILQRTVIDTGSFHRLPMDISKMVQIPNRFSTCI